MSGKGNRWETKVFDGPDAKDIAASLTNILSKRFNTVKLGINKASGARTDEDPKLSTGFHGR